MAKPYARLRATISREGQARAEKQARQLLADIRKQERMTQVELASALGVSQAAVSKLEKQKDMAVGTLRRYVEAVGGSLEIRAKLPGGEYRLDHLLGTSDDASTRRKKIAKHAEV